MRAWRPDGWKPAIEIRGAGHVAEARAKGGGIIFWAGNFSFNDLVGKMALHQLGLSVAISAGPSMAFHFRERALAFAISMP